jgi:hypothetical protein
MREAPAGVVIRVTVDKIYGTGPWAKPLGG